MLRADIRAAFRRLNQRSWFALGAIASLAIGMSLATAVFSVIDSVMLRPLPYGESSRIGFVFQTMPNFRLDGTYSSAKLATTLRAEATAFDQIAVGSQATAAMVVPASIS